MASCCAVFLPVNIQSVLAVRHKICTCSTTQDMYVWYDTRYVRVVRHKICTCSTTQDMHVQYDTRHVRAVRHKICMCSTTQDMYVQHDTSHKKSGRIRSMCLTVFAVTLLSATDHWGELSFLRGVSCGGLPATGVKVVSRFSLLVLVNIGFTVCFNFVPKLKEVS